MAQPAPAVDDYVVTLKTGLTIAGSLVELVPNSRIVLLLSSGATRQLDWADIEIHHPVRSDSSARYQANSEGIDVSRAPSRQPSAGAPQTPAAMPVPQAPTPVDQPRRDQIYVRVVSNDPRVGLFRWTDSKAGYALWEHERWTLVCRPEPECNTLLNRRILYGILGKGFTPKEFRLPPEGDARLKIQVTARPSIWFRGGLSLMGLGVLSMVSGSALLSVTGATTGDRTPLFVAGGILLPLGTAAIAGGITMMTRSGTRISIKGDQD